MGNKDHLVEKRIIDKNGVARRVRVRPGAPTPATKAVAAISAPPSGQRQTAPPSQDGIEDWAHEDGPEKQARAYLQRWPKPGPEHSDEERDLWEFTFIDNADGEDEDKRAALARASEGAQKSQWLESAQTQTRQVRPDSAINSTPPGFTPSTTARVVSPESASESWPESEGRFRNGVERYAPRSK